MKAINLKTVVITMVACTLMLLASRSSGQGLGNTKGNNFQIGILSGATGSNFFSNRSWLVRNANGTDWLTARLHDGISIDGSYLTPQSNTRTWWERDPYHNVQSWGNANQSYLTINQGKIGIGTTDPVSRLALVDGGTGWLITSNSHAVNTGEINGIKLLNGYANETNKWAGMASVAENTHSNSTGLALYAGSSEKLRIASGGNVGIGTTSPTAKLAVNGNIRAKEVKVEAAPWPDYVFEEGYELPDLSELSTYIKVNKRLPGMPSAKEVESDGIDLGEMNRLLLEKVEELTLLLIDKDKAMAAMLQRLEYLERKRSDGTAVNHDIK